MPNIPDNFFSTTVSTKHMAVVPELISGYSTLAI